MVTRKLKNIRTIDTEELGKVYTVKYRGRYFAGENIEQLKQMISDKYGNEGDEVEEARFGYNGIVKSPTLFLAGESGSEHVRIRPMKGSKPQRNNIYDWRNFI